jgi:hypothetical protein
MVERGSLEIQAYDELCFPELAAEWGEQAGRRPFVGALTLELPTDADDEVLSWIAAGAPPIYFGFGSTPIAFPADMLAMISAACAQLILRLRHDQPIWAAAVDRLKVGSGRQFSATIQEPPVATQMTKPAESAATPPSSWKMPRGWDALTARRRRITGMSVPYPSIWPEIPRSMLAWVVDGNTIRPSSSLRARS